MPNRNTTLRTRRARSTALACFCAALCLCAGVSAQRRAPSGAAAGQERARLAPPAAVTCDRNRLTLYSGRVISYSRTQRRTTLTIATDWDTTERVTLRHARAGSPRDSFLIGGQKFADADWRRIERRRGVLRRRSQRVNAWVCGDEAEIIDWQAAAE